LAAPFAVSVALCLLAIGFAPPAAAQTTLAAVNVGASATTSVTVTVTTAGVLGAISARMMGAEGLDFTNAGGGSCAIGTAYAVNTTCTVNVGFAPKLAGQRRGAVVLLDSSGNVLGTEYLQGTGNGPQATILTQVGAATGIPAATAVYYAGLAVDANETIWQSSEGTPTKIWASSNGAYTLQSSLPLGIGSGLAFDGAGFVYGNGGSEEAGRIVPTAPGGGLGGLGYQFQPCGDTGGLYLTFTYATDGAGNGYAVSEDAINSSGLSFSSGTCATFSAPIYFNCYSCVSYSALTVDPSGNFILNIVNPGVTSPPYSALYKESSQQGNAVSTQISLDLSSPESPVSDGSGNIFVADGEPGYLPNGSQSTFLAALQPDGTYNLLGGSGNHTGPLALDGNGNLFTDGGAYEFHLLNPSAVPFPSTGQGQSSAQWLITVANTGNAPLTVGSVTYPTDFPEAKGVSGDCAAGQSVAVGGFCTITVVFSPTASLGGATSQTLSETVKLVSNSLNGSATEQDIPVTGTETLPVPTVALSSSADPAASGSAVTFTAALTAAKGVAVPTGTVVFLDGTTTLGSAPVSAGAASCTAAGLADGVHSITAQYSGDAANAAATSAALTQTMGVSTPVIAWPTPAAITYPTPLGATQLDATASDAGTMAAVAGTFAYSPAAGTVLAAGQQTLTTTFTPASTALYRPATASVMLTVNPNSPAIALTSSANPSMVGASVTFTASVTAASGTPTGTVSYLNGATQLGSAALASGTASYSTSALAAGSYSITAVYSGDANFSSVTSAALTQVVNAPAPDFTLSITPASATVSPGKTVAFTVTVTPLNGFGSQVTFSCTGLPSEASCAPNPTALTPNGAPATGTLTIVTTAPAVSANRAPEMPPGFGAAGQIAFAGLGLGALAMILLPRRYRSRAGWLPVVLLAVGTLGAALGLSGCGAIKSIINQNTDPGTPAGTYTVAVTGGSLNSDGTTTAHSTTVSLTVQ
jgi:hypothetical protein